MVQRSLVWFVSAALVTVFFGCVGERSIVVGFAAATTAIPTVPTGLATPSRPGTTDEHAPARPRPDAGGMPLIRAEPADVVLPFSPLQKTRSTPVQLKNTGTGALHIERLALEGATSFSVRAAGPKSWLLNHENAVLELVPPIVLKPGAALSLVVQHTSGGHAPEVAVLRVRSNDPTREKSLAVTLRANVEPSCLTLSPEDVLDFAKVDVATCRTRLLEARNCGDIAVVIEDAGLLNPGPTTPFSVSWGAGQTGQPWIDQAIKAGAAPSLIIEPGAKTEIAVTYCPATPLPAGQHDSASLALITSAGNHHVILRGEPVVPKCPKAIAGVAQVEAAAVGSTLQLTSFDSKASIGGITKWAWSVKTPPSSQAVLLPNAASASPSLLIDVAGSYTFCVDVWDSAGTKSCMNSCLTVHATESETYQSGGYGAGPVW